MPFEQLEKPPEREGEFERSPEEQLALEIIEHPIVQNELERYKIFSKGYLEEESPEKKKEMGRRADEVLGEDPIYQDISKLIESGELKKPLENEDFIKYVTAELEGEELDKIKEAKEEGNFDETVREILINRQIEREIKEREEKGILTERTGKMWIEVINDEEGRLHLPRIAEDPWETFQGIKESLGHLSTLLSTDERFKNVERLEILSWLFGQKGIARRLDRTFGWRPWTKEEMDKFAEEKPEAFEETQNVGIIVSPHLFEEYLLKGERPEIGGRRISKEEFIEKMKTLKK